MSREFSPPSPEIVAQSFVKQYYEVLTNNPSDLYRFYKADSFFTYCQGHQTEEPLIGAEQLKNTASTFNFKGTRINLSEGSIDAQKSGTGVLLVVTGEFTLPGGNPKTFVQTFFLAGEPSTLTFYVRNSVLRLLGDLTQSGATTDGNANIMQPINKNQLHNSETQTGSIAEEVEQTPAPVAESAPEVVEKTEPTATAELVAVEPIAEIDRPEIDDVNEDDEEEDQEDAGDADDADEPAEEEPEVVVEPPPAEIVASAPKTYADMAKAGTPVVSPNVAVGAPGRKRPPVVSTARTATVPESPATPADASATPKGKVDFAIYVSKIPDNTTELELTTLFTPFGKVVKTELIPGKGYAFVSVETEASLQAVLAHPTPFEIRGAALNVEEKNSKGGGGGGRRGDRSGRSRSGGTGGATGVERGSGGGSGAPRSGRSREGGRERGERGDKDKEKGGVERGDRGERGGDRDRNRGPRNGDSGKGGGGPRTGGAPGSGVVQSKK